MIKSSHPCQSICLKLSVQKRMSENCHQKPQETLRNTRKRIFLNRHSTCTCPTSSTASIDLNFHRLQLKVSLVTYQAGDGYVGSLKNFNSVNQKKEIPATELSAAISSSPTRPKVSPARVPTSRQQQLKSTEEYAPSQRRKKRSPPQF